MHCYFIWKQFITRTPALDVAKIKNKLMLVTFSTIQEFYEMKIIADRQNIDRYKGIILAVNLVFGDGVAERLDPLTLIQRVVISEPALALSREVREDDLPALCNSR